MCACASSGDCSMYHCIGQESHEYEEINLPEVFASVNGCTLGSLEGKVFLNKELRYSPDALLDSVSRS